MSARSLLDSLRSRALPARRHAGASGRRTNGAAATLPPRPPSADESIRELEQRRDALTARVAELQWDLGGIAYEMAIRDHMRVNVLVRRAAVLQEVDAELAEVERILRMEQTGAAGECANCGAPHSSGAVFCWQCGQPLMDQVPSHAIGTA
jgi:hypothetical protein